MQREYKIGNKINDWTVISEPYYENDKQKVLLKCKCGRERIYDVRSVNRIRFSNACKRCGQLERHKKHGRAYDVGDIFMNLEVIKIYSGKNTTYKVKCLTCGNIYHTGHETLYRKKNNKGLPYCKECFDYDKRSKKDFTMCTEHISLTTYKILERQASLRGIKFDVTPEYLESIFDGHCYLSGLPIEIGTHSQRNKKNMINNNGTASLDRIDSNIGYVEGNLAWCLKSVNLMKQKTGQKEFIEMCRIIANNNK